MVQSQHMDRTEIHNEAKSPPSRPMRVTLLAVGVLTIASLYLLRLVYTIQQWHFLSGLNGLSPLYLALTGLIWASAGLLLFWGLWRGHTWAAKFAPGFMLVFTLYYWLDHIFTENRAVSLVNWPVTAALTVISLAYTFWALRTRASSDYFKV